MVSPLPAGEATDVEKVDLFEQFLLMMLEFSHVTGVGNHLKGLYRSAARCSSLV